MSDTRAVVFDLDDTLYPYRRFVSSGFRAVAGVVEREYGVPAGLALRTLFQARASGGRGRELQRLCGALGLPSALAATLRTVIREHVPTLRLPEPSRRVLQRLRPSWRLGILTNGDPAIQLRKVAALGVGALVDAVVFANACGDGRGKPAREGFQAVLARLGAPARSAVFVGDDGVADMHGATGAGMNTIHLLRYTRRVPEGRPVTGADAVVASLLDVPEVAERLVFKGEDACHSRSLVVG